MAFDLSWLWSLLDSIKTTLNSWFAGIWTQVQNITNTGQGIFAGLVALGSQIWDALTKFASTVGKWFYDAYNWIYSGLVSFASIFGQWLNSAFTFLAQGVAWLGSQFYNIGNWIYNAIYTLWNWVMNAITSVWNTLVSWFAGICTAIGTWWSSVITGINTWFTNLLKGFRNKVVQTIMADLTIAGAWKGAERILAPKELKDVGYGLVGIIASPIVGRIVGEIVNAVVPLPSSATYPLIPDITGFSYTPPSISIPTPTEKPAPTPTVAGAPVGVFTGLAEANLTLPKTTYEVSVMAGQDLSRQIIGLSYEVEVA